MGTEIIMATLRREIFNMEMRRENYSKHLELIVSALLMGANALMGQAGNPRHHNISYKQQ